MGGGSPRGASTSAGEEGNRTLVVVRGGGGNREAASNGVGSGVVGSSAWRCRRHLRTGHTLGSTLPTEERVEGGVGYRWMFWIMPVVRRMFWISWFLVPLRMVIEVSIKLPKTCKIICLSTGGGSSNISTEQTGCCARDVIRATICPMHAIRCFRVLVIPASNLLRTCGGSVAHLTSAMGIRLSHFVFRCIELNIGLVILYTFCSLIPYHVPVNVQKGGDLHAEPYSENHPKQYALLFSASR